MSLHFEPLSDVLGAEVIGLDLHQPIADADAAALRQALLDHQVLLVRQDGVDDREHVRFCKAFGEIQAERTVPDDESEEIEDGVRRGGRCRLADLAARSGMGGA